MGLCYKSIRLINKNVNVLEIEVKRGEFVGF